MKSEIYVLYKKIREMTKKLREKQKSWYSDYILISEFRICSNCNIYSVFPGWKTIFLKYDDVIVTSWLVAQVWELGISCFWMSIPSGTIISSQTFLRKKAKSFQIGTCLLLPENVLRPFVLLTFPGDIEMKHWL